MKSKLVNTIGVLFILFSTSLYASQAPYIVLHPQNLLVVEGDTASFQVDAGGNTPLSYQWYSDTGAITGATNQVLNIPGVIRSQNGTKFYCVVSNSYGSNTTRTAEMSVRRPSSQLIAVTGELFNTKYSMGDEVDVDFIVKLYSSENNDSVLYTEYFLSSENKSVKVDKGNFLLRLGEGRTDDDLRSLIQNHPNLYISFSVAYPNGNFETLTPRSPLTSSPYAFAGAPEVIRGSTDPRTAEIDAPIGTHFIDKNTGKTYIKTHNSWSELQ